MVGVQSVREEHGLQAEAAGVRTEAATASQPRALMNQHLRLFEALRQQKIRWFMRYVVKRDDGCWEYIGKRDKNGYGKSRVIPLTWHAHRAAYFLFIGDVPDYLCVCHRCDRPWCVSPDHLFLGTQAENISDKVRKGRTAFGDKHGSKTHPEKIRRGINHWNAKISENVAVEIKQLLQSPNANCRAIAREYGVHRGVVYNIKYGNSWRHL